MITFVGLRYLRDLGEELDIPMFVYGPETHMTAIGALRFLCLCSFIEIFIIIVSCYGT